MCRSIVTLREPFVEEVTEADIRAAALQYVRKVSGFRTPAAHNAEAFDAAVAAVADATRTLLAELVVRPSPNADTPDVRREKARAARLASGRG
jgi:hypothetical protein